MSDSEHPKVGVYIPTLVYPIRTKNVKRTLEKLLKKGYKESNIDIVLKMKDGVIHIWFEEEDGNWHWRHESHDPVFASRHNILNAYGSEGIVGETIEDVLKYVKEVAELDF